MLLLGFIPLLAVLTAGSFGAAFPQHALRKGCSLFKYKFLVPHETKAMQKMKQHFEEDIRLLSDRKCNARLFHRKWNPAELSVPDRMMLVEAELDLVIAMLELPADPSFTKTRQRPLAFLSQAREDLRGCVSDPPRLPWPRATSAAPVPAAAPRGTADPYAAAFLADGHGGSFASALWETEALAAEAADGQGNRDHQLPGGLCHHPHLPSAGRPAVRSLPGAMHLAPASTASGMAWHGTAPTRPQGCPEDREK
ncbi:uncharacterized protein LOC134518996 isoform X1 [Chroicocephalus ridibundus]|uniref:uncharacterized protein LOC134518996 isoform X1 n=1 Tax=Chroicocephalus ridibundus TaxID=1192867 RepID=UPI002FDE2071